MKNIELLYTMTVHGTLILKRIFLYGIVISLIIVYLETFQNSFMHDISLIARRDGHFLNSH